MARIIYSALIDSIKGSIGGTTFQSNKYGYTIKRKPNMINPNTPDQRTQKILFAQATKAWRGLSSAQRADWVTWAATYPQYAKNNPTSELSGYAVFVKVHVFRLMCGLAILPNPTYASYGQLNYNWELWRDTATLHLNDTDSLGVGNWYNLGFFSRPYTSTQNFIGTTPKYMYFGLDSGDDINIYAPYVAKYGRNLEDTELTSVKIVSIGKDNGEVLAPDRFIIAAQQE
jgi:hypothetical protein